MIKEEPFIFTWTLPFILLGNSYCKSQGILEATSTVGRQIVGNECMANRRRKMSDESPGIIEGGVLSY